MVRSMKLTATGLVLLMVSLAAGESQPGSHNTNAKSPNKGRRQRPTKAENASRQLARSFYSRLSNAVRPERHCGVVDSQWRIARHIRQRLYDGRDAIERKFARPASSPRTWERRSN